MTVKLVSWGCYDFTDHCWRHYTMLWNVYMRGIWSIREQNKSYYSKGEQYMAYIWNMEGTVIYKYYGDVMNGHGGLDKVAEET